MARLIAVLFYAALAILILTFIFMNRDVVSITLLPFSAPVTAPLYIALAALFVTGLAMGLVYSAIISISYSRKLRRATRALEQMEKELNIKSSVKATP